MDDFVYTGGSINPFHSAGTAVSSGTAIIGTAADYAPVTMTGDGYHAHQDAPGVVPVAPTAAPVHHLSRLEVGTLDGATTVIAALAVTVAVARLARAAFSGLYRIAMSYNRGLDRDKDGIACEKL